MSGRKPEPDNRIAFMDKKRAIPAIAGFVVFVFISCLVVTQNTQAFDSNICSYVYGHRSAGLTVFFKAVTYMGNWQTVSLLCIILLLLPGTRFGVGVPISFAAILATCIQKSLKLAFHRARPDIALFLVREGGYSFPSAHSFTNFVFYGLIIYLCRQKIKDKRLANAITVLLVILIFLIGISRVYLGVHFPSDVLGAWALALCVLMILISGDIKLKTILNGKKE
jgi:undecaprenyl-diphosphatase